MAVFKYAALRRDKERYYKQKSRVKWLEHGDQNTKFFFRAAGAFYSRSRIRSVTKEDGSCLTDQEEIQGKTVAYFKRLWGSQCDNTDLIFDTIEQSIHQRLNLDQQRELEKDVDEEEIRVAMFSIKDDKAPGPDGYNSYFFQKVLECRG